MEAKQCPPSVASNSKLSHARRDLISKRGWDAITSGIVRTQKQKKTRTGVVHINETEPVSLVDVRPSSAMVKNDVWGIKQQRHKYHPDPKHLCLNEKMVHLAV